MARIEDDKIPSTVGSDEEALKKHAAIHLEGTGFPWQPEANVYIAGHRLGFPNTESWLTFWDLNKVDVGDEVFVTDADGTEYTYRSSRSSGRPIRHLRHGRPSRARTSLPSRPAPCRTTRSA
jgi:sortase A